MPDGQLGEASPPGRRAARGRRGEAVEARERFEPARVGGECVCTSPERSLRSSRPGERCSTLEPTRAAERRFVPLVRRAARRAGLDPPRRSGSGTDPPVFYGGKPGKSLTAIPIMAFVARVWKITAAFACCETALILRRRGRAHQTRTDYSDFGSRERRICTTRPTGCAYMHACKGNHVRRAVAASPQLLQQNTNESVNPTSRFATLNSKVESHERELTEQFKFVRVDTPSIKTLLAECSFMRFSEHS